MNPDSGGLTLITKPAGNQAWLLSVRPAASLSSNNSRRQPVSSSYGKGTKLIKVP